MRIIEFDELNRSMGINLSFVDVQNLMKLKVEYLVKIILDTVAFTDDKILLMRREVIYSQTIITKLNGLFYKAIFSINLINDVFLILIELEEIVYCVKRSLIFNTDHSKYFGKENVNKRKMIDLLSSDRKKQRSLNEMMKIKTKSMIDRNFLLIEDFDDFIKFIL